MIGVGRVVRMREPQIDMISGRTVPQSHTASAREPAIRSEAA